MQKQASMNLAPVQPLQEVANSQLDPTPIYIVDGLKEVLQDVLMENKETFEEIANTSEITSNFIQGKQIWNRNYWTGQWRAVQGNMINPNIITAINIMQFYATSQIKSFISSNPDLEPLDTFSDRANREKNKIAKATWNFYEPRFYTNRFNQAEALHAIITGTYIESVRHDPFGQGLKGFREIFGVKNVETEAGGSECFQCGFKGNYKDFIPTEETVPSCPECGSFEILPPKQAESQDFNSVLDVEEVNYGCLDLRLIPIQTVRFDIKGRPEESSRFLERIVMPRRKLNYLLGNFDIPYDTANSDAGLRSIEAIQTAGNTLQGQASMVSTSKFRGDWAIVDRLCLKKEDVHHIIPDRDTMTLSGQMIPKGVRLSELCPEEGMTVLSVADGTYILGIYLGEHQSLELSTGSYHSRFESGVGRGSEDTVEVQKRFNRFDAQNVMAMEAGSTPGWTYIKGSVDKAHIKKIGKPNEAIPINMEIAKALGTADVINKLQPAQIPAQIFQYTYDILNQYRQLTSHSTGFTNAFPGVSNDTATGARLAKASEDSISTPMLLVKGDVRTGTAINTLKAHHKYFQGIAHYFPMGSAENQKTVGKYIKGEEVDPTTMFRVVRNSEQPKTMYDRQMDFVNMLATAGSAGGVEVLKQQDPKLYSALLKAFDLELNDDVYETVVNVCEERLEEALEIYKQYQMFSQMAEAQGIMAPAPPMDAIGQVLSNPVMLEEPNLMQKATWFMDYLDTPEGLTLDAQQRQLIGALVRVHFQGFVQHEQAKAVGFMQAQGMEDQFEAQKAAEFEKQEAQKQAEMEKSDQQHLQNQEKELTKAEIKASSDEQKNQHQQQQMVLQSGLNMYEQANAPVDTSKTTKKR